MAKALLGHMSTTDPRVHARLVAENRRLRERVADLEAHVLRLQADHDALVAARADEPLLSLGDALDADRMQPA
jgi:cell division protein FtsB